MQAPPEVRLKNLSRLARARIGRSCAKADKKVLKVGRSSRLREMMRVSLLGEVGRRKH